MADPLSHCVSCEVSKSIARSWGGKYYPRNSWRNCRKAFYWNGSDRLWQGPYSPPLRGTSEGSARSNCTDIQEHNSQRNISTQAIDKKNFGAVSFGLMAIMLQQLAREPTGIRLRSTSGNRVNPQVNSDNWSFSIRYWYPAACCRVIHSTCELR